MELFPGEFPASEAKGNWYPLKWRASDQFSLFGKQGTKPHSLDPGFRMLEANLFLLSIEYVHWIQRLILVDLAYTGWVDKDRTHLDLSSWAEERAEIIELLGKKAVVIQYK